MENCHDKSLLWPISSSPKWDPHSSPGPQQAVTGTLPLSVMPFNARELSSLLYFEGHHQIAPTEPGLILPLLKAQSFFSLEKMQRHPLWLLHWNEGEFFAGIPCTDSSRCVCASLNMLQQRCCVCRSHRLLNYSWLPHSKILPVSYFAGEKGQSNIYIAAKPWTTPETIFIKRLNMLW